MPAAIQARAGQGHVSHHEVLRDPGACGQILANRTQRRINVQRAYTDLPLPGQQPSQMPLATAPIDHGKARPTDRRDKRRDLRPLAPGDLPVPEPVMALKGFSPTGSHIGQFRHHRDLGNMTGNKGRRSVAVVGKPGLIVIVKRQQVVSQ